MVDGALFLARRWRVNDARLSRTSVSAIKSGRARPRALELITIIDRDSEGPGRSTLWTSRAVSDRSGSSAGPDLGGWPDRSVRHPIVRARRPKTARRDRLRPAPPKPPDQPDHLDAGQERHEPPGQEPQQDEPKGGVEHPRHRRPGGGATGPQDRRARCRSVAAPDRNPADGLGVGRHQTDTLSVLPRGRPRRSRSLAFRPHPVERRPQPPDRPCQMSGGRIARWTPEIPPGC